MGGASWDFSHPQWHVDRCGHCSSLILTTMLLGFFGLSFPVLYRRYNTTRDIPVLALIIYLSSILRCFLRSRCRGTREMSAGVRQSIVRCDILASCDILSCSWSEAKKKLLWHWVRTTFICWGKDDYLEYSLGLYWFKKVTAKCFFLSYTASPTMARLI